MKTITVPADKSISHRGVLFGALARGVTRVTNFLQAGDTLHTLQAMQALGVRIERDGGTLTVHGTGVVGLRAPAGELYLGNSGTSTRLLLGVLAGRPFPVTLTGDPSLSRRPMRRVVEPLTAMGARFAGNDNGNKLPLTVTGGALHGIRYDLPTASAQVKSALLLAGLQAEGTTSLREPALSRDHTERMLRGFGVPVQERDGRLEITRSELTATEVAVPGDISSAAFFLVGAAIGGPATRLTGVGLNPTRTGVIDALRRMGADLTIEHQRTVAGEEVGDIVIRPSRLRGTTIGGGEIPRLIDELPVLALAAACAEGETRVTGAHELRVKESDRIAVVAREFARRGVLVEELPDGFIIRGPQRFRGGAGECDYDHRIAMTMLMANVVSDGEITMPGSGEHIQTSFPGFTGLFRDWLAAT